MALWAVNLFTVDRQMILAIRKFNQAVCQEYADILTSLVTRQYILSLLLGMIMVVPMLRITQFVLHRTGIVNVLCIQLGRVATWLDTALYQWMLRHPTQMQ